MSHNPNIPMSPDELQQQRIHEVVELPERPEPFDCRVGYSGEVPWEIVPKSVPRSLIYLGQVEWAWSPMHNRLDAYYLHRGRTHWLLWLCNWDDNWSKWEFHPVACVEKKCVSQAVAANHLLAEYWMYEQAESDLDRFHWINEEDYLSIAEVAAIGRHVWG
jgi:hypothetical protein